MSHTSDEVAVPGFTPGPWEWDGCAQIVEAARPHMRVAFLPSDGLSYASGEPTARLIAAAPQMYEALANALQSLDTDGPGAAAAALNTHGRAALKAARGE